MATFDYSQCRFITTNKNPLQYYLNTIKKSLKLFLPEEKIEENFKFLKNDLEEKIRDKGENINDPKTLYTVCYYTFSRVWYSLAQATYYYTGKPFALECFEYNEDHEVVFKNNGFFSKIQQQVKNTLYDESIQVLLSSKDQFGNYAVVDFEELSRHINNAIRNYYDAAEKTDPRLLKSKLPTKALHNSVEKSVREFELQLNKIIHNYNPNPGGYTI